jgi:hypothetical protein
MADFEGISGRKRGQISQVEEDCAVFKKKGNEQTGIVKRRVN